MARKKPKSALGRELVNLVEAEFGRRHPLPGIVSLLACLAERDAKAARSGAPKRLKSGKLPYEKPTVEIIGRLQDGTFIEYMPAPKTGTNR